MPISVDLEENPLFVEIFERYAAEGERRGEQRGRQLGEQRGIVLGKSALLQRQLEKRFQTLPDWAKTKLEQATDVELELWGLRLFDAQCLEEVFKVDGNADISR